MRCATSLIVPLKYFAVEMPTISPNKTANMTNAAIIASVAEMAARSFLFPASSCFDFDSL